VSDTTAFICAFSAIGLDDVPLVGDKNASLGELYSELAQAGIRVPDGFAITADRYRYFMRVTALAGKVEALTQGLDPRAIWRNVPNAASPFAKQYLAPPSRPILKPRSPVPTTGWATANRSTSRCVAARPPKTCRRELCRPAGNLSERSRTRRIDRGVPSRFRVTLYRSGDFIERGQRF
jgi:hypothetical protein